MNVTVVEGEAGLLVVDTHASLEAGRAVLADLRRLSPRPLVGGREHPRALRPHLRQRGLPRGVRRGADHRPRDRGRRDVARRGVRARARGRARPARRSPRPDRPATDLLLGHGRSTSATGRSSSCTPVAATPTATSSYGSGTRTCSSPATWSRSPGCRRTATTAIPLEWPLVARPRARARRAGHGRRARARRAGRPRVRRRSSARRSGSWPQTIRDLAARGVPVDQALGDDRVALPDGAPRGRRTTWLRAPAELAEAAAARMSAPGARPRSACCSAGGRTPTSRRSPS